MFEVVFSAVDVGGIDLFMLFPVGLCVFLDDEDDTLLGTVRQAEVIREVNGLPFRHDGQKAFAGNVTFQVGPFRPDVEDCIGVLTCSRMVVEVNEHAHVVHFPVGRSDVRIGQCPAGRGTATGGKREDEDEGGRKDEDAAEQAQRILHGC